MTRTPDAHRDRATAVVRRLKQRHPRVAESTIEGWVAQVFDSYRFARVQAYVPILAEREVEARLRDVEDEAEVQLRLADG